MCEWANKEVCLCSAWIRTSSSNTNPIRLRLKDKTSIIRHYASFITTIHYHLSMAVVLERPHY